MQVFYKILADLHSNRFKNVTLIYFAENEEDLYFLPELEYWKKESDWKVTVSATSKESKDWPHLTESAQSDKVYAQIEKIDNKTTGIFVSVLPLKVTVVKSKLEAKGANPKNIHFVN